VLSPDPRVQGRRSLSDCPVGSSKATKSDEEDPAWYEDGARTQEGGRVTRSDR
jgi:hypothetical protein